MGVLIIMLLGAGFALGDWIRIPGSGYGPLMALCCVLPVVGFSTLWVMGDAPRHKQSPVLWGLVTFFVIWPVGLLRYVILGRNEPPIATSHQ